MDATTWILSGIKNLIILSCIKKRALERAHELEYTQGKRIASLCIIIERIQVIKISFLMNNLNQFNRNVRYSN